MEMGVTVLERKGVYAPATHAAHQGGEAAISALLTEMADSISRYCAELGIDRCPDGAEMEEMLQLLKLRRRMSRLAGRIIQDDLS